MQLELNRRSTVPMYRQLAAELREQIVSGAMAEGYRSPPNASCPHASKSIAPRCCRRISSSKTKVLSPKVGKGHVRAPACKPNIAHVKQ